MEVLISSAVYRGGDTLWAIPVVGRDMQHEDPFDDSLVSGEANTP